MNNKLAIIGGSGFVGNRLANRLKLSDIPFFIFDKNKTQTEFSFLEIDICDVNSLNKLEGCSTIINLAAVHRDNIKPISKYDEVNVQGSMNICETATKLGINQIIFTSSVAIYGSTKHETKEDGLPNYFNDYGRTKYLAEQVYKEWQSKDSKNRSLVIIRPTVIFGENNRGNVFNLMKQIASSRFIMFGKGQNIKSMAYVENVAAFIEHSIHFSPGIHIYNYVDKPDLNMNELVNLVKEIIFKKKGKSFRLPYFLAYSLGYIADLLSSALKISLPISYIRVKKFLSSSHFSTSIDETGFRPPFDLKEALIRTIEYEFLDKKKDNN